MNDAASLLRAGKRRAAPGWGGCPGTGWQAVLRAGEHATVSITDKLERSYEQGEDGAGQRRLQLLRLVV